MEHIKDDYYGINPVGDGLDEWGKAQVEAARNARKLSVSVKRFSVAAAGVGSLLKRKNEQTPKL